jgi:uncharacterized protein (DUF1697 family)
MKTYIALLRGINVGGHKKVPMAELRSILANSGFVGIKTYIQSGNVVFQTSESKKEVLEEKIKNLILNHFGFEVSVLVRNRSELMKIFNDCPFPEKKKINSYFAILTHIPDIELVKDACQKTYENEEYYIIDDCIYFYCAKGYGKAKFSLNYIERKIKVGATARNYKTMLKLMSMAEESESNT